MPTILDSEYRDALLARFRQLTSDRQPLWGAMSAPKMVCHLSDQLRVALGHLETKDQGSSLTRTLVKWLVLYTPLPTPKGKIMTAREMLTAEPSSWTEDTRAFETLVARFVDAKEVATHPAFGALSHRQWGILTARHVDHHLRQFGV